MRNFAWVLAVVAVGLGVARTGLLLADSGSGAIAGVTEPEPGLATALGEVFMEAVFAGLGALLAARRPRNPIGWLLIATGLSFALLLFAERVAWNLLVAHGEATSAVSFWLWLADWAWIGAVVPLFVCIPLLFPTGRVMSPRWGRLLWTALVATGVLVVATAFAPGQLENYPIENPFGTFAFLVTVRTASFAVLVVCALTSVASLFVRFRRSTGVEREQIKWVWAAGALLVVSFVINGALDTSFPAIAENVQSVGLLAIPAAIAVAILRYHLFDIDVVVNRTLVYGSLTATLAAVYLGGVLLFQLLLAPLTSDSGLAVAISTLAVAGLFGPVRTRIQALVDRRFYRKKYDAARALDLFSTRLRDEIDLDTLVGELSDVLDETMQPAHVSLWLR